MPELSVSDMASEPGGETDAGAGGLFDLSSYLASDDADTLFLDEWDLTTGGDAASKVTGADNARDEALMGKDPLLPDDVLDAFIRGHHFDDCEDQHTQQEEQEQEEAPHRKTVPEDEIHTQRELEHYHTKYIEAGNAIVSTFAAFA